MDLPLPAEARACIDRLAAAGHAAYVVGGCVRDCLRGAPPDDWDLCTDALPEQVHACFEGETVVDTGLRHGTVTAVVGGVPVEITTFRVDGEYLDHRRPATVLFTPSLEEDLARRDFTVNAMAWRPGEPLCDPFGGRADLEAGLLRCVGEPRRRFEEDALRILRLFRFVSQLDFSVEADTLRAASEQRGLLRAVSAERVAAELGKLLCGPAVERALLLAADHGVLDEILPEFAPCIGFDQHSPHHDKTVDRHTFRAVASSPPRLAVRLALLFHDVGKPATYSVGADGRGHFHGHEEAGAGIARAAMARLRLPRTLSEEVEALVRLHMAPPRPDERQLRRLLSRHGEMLVRELIEVKIGDISGRSPVNRAQIDELRAAEALLDELLARPHCLTRKDLAVDGRDLLALGAPPGPALGELLQSLLELVLDDPGRNTREDLLAAARERLDGAGR